MCKQAAYLDSLTLLINQRKNKMRTKCKFTYIVCLLCYPDWMVTFKICDQTCPDEASSVSIRAFKPIMDQLPQIRSNGDIILIKSVKLQRYQDKIFGITSFTTTWIISYLPAISNTVPSTVTFPASMRPQPMELSQLKGLRNWWSSVGGASSTGNAHMGNYQNIPVGSGSMPQTNYQMPPLNNHQVMAPQGNTYQNQAPGIKKGSLKFSLIRDMQVNNFYDLIGLVVKTFSATQNFTLYITDYSRNPMVHSYEWPGNNAGEDEEGNFSRAKRGDGKWPGPWGQYTLQITLWDEHAVAARQILQEAVGVYVGLKNVRAKKNGDGRLEGVLHGEKTMRPGLYLIDDMRDQRVKDIIQRKKEYTRRFNANKNQHEQEQEARMAALRKKKAEVEAERKERQEKGNQYSMWSLFLLHLKRYLLSPTIEIQLIVKDKRAPSQHRYRRFSVPLVSTETTTYSVV